MFENPRRGRQIRNFTTNVPKILDLKSSSEQIFFENCRWVPLISSMRLLHRPGNRLLSGCASTEIVFISSLLVYLLLIEQKYRSEWLEFT